MKITRNFLCCTWIFYHFLITLTTFNNFYFNLKIDFDLIGITESRNKSKKAPANSTGLIKYNTEQTPTDVEKGGALLYILKQLNYKKKKLICKSKNQSKLNQ